MSGWIGVDLDGTLARHDGYVSANHIGEPIQPMVERVKAWIEEGTTVKIFTARACDLSAKGKAAIEHWCAVHIGAVLEITCCKDFDMKQLWDDRAIQVETNTGRLVNGTEAG